MNYKAIIFDLDGTLLDTREYIYQAFEHSFKLHHPTPISREELNSVVGKSLIESYQTLAQLEKVDSYITAHWEFQAQNVHLSTLFPHVLSTIEKLHASKISLAIFTNRAKKSVEDTLANTDLDLYINQLITVDDVTQPKPSPEGVEKALQYSEVDKKDALFVGDTDVDILTGKNAGVKTVGVTYGFGGENIKEAKPDYVIDDISELLELV